MGHPIPSSAAPLPLSIHGHPQPTRRALTSRLVAAGLALGLVGAAGEALLALALGAAGVLLFAGALLTLGLVMVLLALASMHPELTAFEDGLLLQPLVGRPVRLPWSALAALEPHPLIFNNDGLGRLLHGKNYRPRQGRLVIVRPGGLPARYRLADLVTGGPGRPAFAISSTTHTEYGELARLIQDRLSP